MTTTFVSLGGVWLDEIRWDQLRRVDVVGGSATYATLGARFFETDPSRLKLIVNAGYDFPQDVVDELRRWSVDVHMMINESKPCTRGILEHHGTAGSTFTRLTPPLLTSPQDVSTANALDSQIFHMFAVPDLIQTQCLQLKELRRTVTSTLPVVIWEPHPKSCTVPMLKEHIALLHDSLVTVFSPNHHELNAFFAPAAFDRTVIETRAKALFNPPKHMYSADQSRSPGVQVIIIRAAENGCLVLMRDLRSYWLPAFYGADQQDKVVDPTGAGNAFLGGLAQGWLQTGNWIEAACYGMVAASVVIESIGPPSHSKSESEGELWGGVDLKQRLQIYMSRADVRQVLQ